MLSGAFSQGSGTGPSCSPTPVKAMRQVVFIKSLFVLAATGLIVHTDQISRTPS